MQSAFVHIDISQIVVHDGDEPDAVLDLAQSELLSGQNLRDGDRGFVEADVPGSADDDVAVVQWIGQFGQAGVEL